MDKTFRVESKPTLELRVAKISPIKMLAIQTQVDFNSLQQTETVFTFILENVEVKVADQWLPLKEKGRDVFYPVGIENEFNVLYDVVVHFLTNVIKPLFQKSNESNQ